MVKYRFFKWSTVIINKKMKNYDKIVIPNINSVGVAIKFAECNSECKFNQDYLSVSHAKE